MHRKDPNWVLLIGIGLLVLLILNPWAIFTVLGLVYYIVFITLGIVVIVYVLKLLSK